MAGRRWTLKEGVASSILGLHKMRDVDAEGSRIEAIPVSGLLLSGIASRIGVSGGDDAKRRDQSYELRNKSATPHVISTRRGLFGDLASSPFYDRSFLRVLKPVFALEFSVLAKWRDCKEQVIDLGSFAHKKYQNFQASIAVKFPAGAKSNL